MDEVKKAEEVKVDEVKKEEVSGALGARVEKVSKIIQGLQAYSSMVVMADNGKSFELRYAFIGPYLTLGRDSKEEGLVHRLYHPPFGTFAFIPGGYEFGRKFTQAYSMRIAVALSEM